MTSRQLDEEAIFQIARKLDDPSDRSTNLDQVCAGDAPLRERVKALLEAHDRDARQSDLRCVPMPAADWLMMCCDPKGLDSAVEDWEYVQFLIPQQQCLTLPRGVCAQCRHRTGEVPRATGRCYSIFRYGSANCPQIGDDERLFGRRVELLGILSSYWRRGPGMAGHPASRCAMPTHSAGYSQPSVCENYGYENALEEFDSVLHGQ